jgi:hypothetical protein
LRRKRGHLEPSPKNCKERVGHLELRNLTTCSEFS